MPRWTSRISVCKIAMAKQNEDAIQQHQNLYEVKIYFRELHNTQSVETRFSEKKYREELKLWIVKTFCCFKINFSFRKKLLVFS